MNIKTRERIISSMHIHRVWAQQEKKLYTYYNKKDGIVEEDGRCDNIDYLLLSPCTAHMQKFYLLVYELQLAMKKNYQTQHELIIDGIEEFSDKSYYSKYLKALRGFRDYFAHSQGKLIDNRFFTILQNPNFQDITYRIFIDICNFIDLERNRVILSGGNPL